MRKLTLKFKFPCNFHSASEQSRDHKIATIETNPELFGVMKIFISGDNRVFKNPEKHYTGVSNQRVAGGKWIEIKDNRYQSANEWLVYMIDQGAINSDFKGKPRHTS